MENYKTYTKEELQALPEEGLKEKFLEQQDEYQRLSDQQNETQRLIAERDRLLGELEKKVSIFRIMQSCPALRRKIERNSRCLCGSGLKYKKCCIKYESENLSREEAIRRIKELRAL